MRTCQVLIKREAQARSSTPWSVLSLEELLIDPLDLYLVTGSKHLDLVSHHPFALLKTGYIRIRETLKVIPTELLRHDDLVFAPGLFPEISYFFPELRYESVTVGVYPLVLPAVYPIVQVDVDAAVVLFIVLQRRVQPVCGRRPRRLLDGVRLLDGDAVHDLSWKVSEPFLTVHRARRGPPSRRRLGR